MKRIELSDKDERAAADLWRKENPDKSVFACDVDEKNKYRERIIVARTQPYSRGCLARDIPGASCQFPNCDC